MTKSFAAIALASIIAVSTTANATTYVWDNNASEDQVKNSGVGDGSTDSAATGHVLLRYDTVSKLFSWDISWDSLEGLLSAIHFHGPAGPDGNNMIHLFNIFTAEQDVIDSGVDRTTGSTSGLMDFEDFLAATGSPFNAETNLGYMVDEMFYGNIHSNLWPMGEIRAHQFLTSTLENQTKPQQKCAKLVALSTTKVSAAGAKAVGKCLKDGAKGKLAGSTFSTCASGMDATERVDGARSKAAGKVSSKCSGNDKNAVPNLPPFGVAASLLAPGEDGTGGLARTESLQGLIQPGLSGDTQQAEFGCAQGMADELAPCVKTYQKYVAKCLKSGLAGKNTQSFVLAGDLDSCLLGEDASGKVAEACDDAVVAPPIAAACGAVAVSSVIDFSLLSPIPGSDAEAIDQTAARVRCASCLEAAFRHDLDPADSCELWDNGADDGSCSVALSAP